MITTTHLEVVRSILERSRFLAESTVDKIRYQWSLNVKRYIMVMW